MGDIDTQELEVRLGYWIRHNREHGDEFREWAGKAPSICYLSRYMVANVGIGAYDNIYCVFKTMPQFMSGPPVAIIRFRYF